MINFETFQDQCSYTEYDFENEELLCTARQRLDLCTERFCPVMKERLDDEEPV